jgi:hypothetical protein
MGAKHVDTRRMRQRVSVTPPKPFCLGGSAVSKSSRNSSSSKATKRHKDFLLFPHATGRWAKKIKGKLHYFGKTADDPKGEAALAKWLEQKDALLAGRVPRPKSDEVTVGALCNRFLSSELHLVETGEIRERTFYGND